MGTASEESGVSQKSQAELDAEAAVKEAEANLDAVKKAEGDLDIDKADPAATTTDTPADSQEAPQEDAGEVPTVSELADAANYLRGNGQVDVDGFAKVAAYLDKVSEVRIAEGAETASPPAAPESVGDSA